MWDRIHNWLIKTLIGSKMVIMNAEIHGATYCSVKEGRAGGLIYGSAFVRCAGVGFEGGAQEWLSKNRDVVETRRQEWLLEVENAKS